MYICIVADNEVVLSLAGGFVIHAWAVNDYLSVRVEVPSSMIDDGGRLEGLMGNLNDDASDDLTDWKGEEFTVSKMSKNEMYQYQDSCEYNVIEIIAGNLKPLLFILRCTSLFPQSDRVPL